jgi:hypothetical protein
MEGRPWESIAVKGIDSGSVVGLAHLRAGLMTAAAAARGIVRAQPDVFIAATAQVQALTLDTRNVRDFEHRGLALTNPFSP